MLRLVAAGLAATSRTISSTTEPKRVLLLRPDHIGDVLLTSPAVAMLRSSLPTAHLTYIVGPWGLEAARSGPSVDTLRTMRYPGFTRRSQANLVGPYALLAREAVRLRREAHDMAIVFRPDHWWGALLALTAGIPLRIGGDLPLMRSLLSHTQKVEPGQPAAEHALDLARLALRVSGVSPLKPEPGRPVFSLSDRSHSLADAIWQRNRFTADQRVIGIHPNAGAPLKSWPVADWAHLADRLIERGLGVLLVGAPDDGQLLSAIQGRMTRPSAGTAHGQGLDVSAALYTRCVLVVGLDSGATHLAASVGTPTVRLYGPASVEVFGPWPARQDQRVLVTDKLACVPCGHLEAPPCGATSLPACLLAVGVEAVLNAIELQLARD